MSGERRDCTCPRVKHTHGTVRAYVADGCRCAACSTVRCRWLKAQQHRTATHGPYSHLTFRSSVGAMRRLQALAVAGWSADDLAPLLGTAARNVVQWRLGQRGRRITAQNHAKIAAVYDQRWNQPPPGRYAVKVRNCAHKRGWAPALAWDDDTIDDPAAVPYTPPTCVDFTHPDLPRIAERRIHSAPADIDDIAVERAMRGEPMKLTRRERTVAVRELHSRGLNETEIGRRLRMSGSSVTAYLQREEAA